MIFQEFLLLFLVDFSATYSSLPYHQINLPFHFPVRPCPLYYIINKGRNTKAAASSSLGFSMPSCVIELALSEKNVPLALSDNPMEKTTATASCSFYLAVPCLYIRIPSLTTYSCISSKRFPWIYQITLQGGSSTRRLLAVRPHPSYRQARCSAGDFLHRSFGGDKFSPTK